MRVTPSLILPISIAAIAASAADGLAQVSRIPVSRLPQAVRTQIRRDQVVKISDQATDTVRAAGSTINLGRDQVLATRIGDSARFWRAVAPPADTVSQRDPGSLRSDSAYTMPFAYFAVGDGGQPRSFRPVYVTQGGLRYQPAEDRFQGTLLVGVEDDSDPPAQYPLPTSVVLTVGGEADSVSPVELRFERTGTSYQPVTVVARTPRDSVRVDLVPPFDPKGVPVWLPVQPTLTFERPPRSIQGFGIGTARLRIGVRGTVLRDSVTVSVSTDAGSISADEIRVGPAGGSVTLKSGGPLGLATVTATSPGFAKGEATVVFTWPLLFLTFTVAGGGLGVIWAWLQRRKHVTTSGTRGFFGALLGAVLATAIYVGLGINLVSFVVTMPLGSELAVFGFSALGGMVGVKVAGMGDKNKPAASAGAGKNSPD